MSWSGVIVFALVKSNSFCPCLLCGFLLGLQVFDLPLFTSFSPWIFILYSEAELAKGLQLLNLFFIVVVFESYFIKIYSRMPSMWLSPKTDKNGIFLENMVWLLSSNSYPSVPVRTLTSEFQNHLTFLLGLSKKSSHSILWNHVWELLKILKMSPLKNGCLNHTRITHFRDIAFANPWWESR